MKNRVLGIAAIAAALGGGNLFGALKHGSGEPIIPVFRGGRHGRSRVPGKANPPGTKIAKRVMKARGLQWNGEIFHGGEITKAAAARSALRKQLKEAA